MREEIRERSDNKHESCPNCNGEGGKRKLSRLERIFGVMPHFMRPFLWGVVIVGILSLFIGMAVAIATGHGLAWLISAIAGGV